MNVKVVKKRDFSLSEFVSLTRDCFGGRERKTVMLCDRRIVTLFVALISSNQLALADEVAATGGQIQTLEAAQLNQESNLMVPQGNTLLIHFENTDSVQISGSIQNSGNIYAYTRNPSISTVTFAAQNIQNMQNAVISTMIPADIAAFVGSNLQTIGLQLVASESIVNSGMISSAANLAVISGGRVDNLQTSVNSVASMFAVNNLNIVSAIGQINNSGTIVSQSGNINIATELNRTIMASIQSPSLLQSVVQDSLLSTLTVNSELGSLMAANGVINLRDSEFNALADLNITSAKISSKQLNLFSGQGNVNANLGEVQGTVNTYAGSVHMGASSPVLELGEMCISGDPVYWNNNGDIVIGRDLDFTSFYPFGFVWPYPDENQLPADNLGIYASKDVIINGNVKLLRGLHVAIVAGFDYERAEPQNRWGYGMPNIFTNHPYVSRTGGNIDFTATNNLILKQENIVPVIEIKAFRNNQFEGGQILAGPANLLQPFQVRSYGFTGQWLTFTGSLPPPPNPLPPYPNFGPPKSAPTTLGQLNPPPPSAVASQTSVPLPSQPQMPSLASGSQVPDIALNLPASASITPPGSTAPASGADLLAGFLNKAVDIVFPSAYAGDSGGDNQDPPNQRTGTNPDGSSPQLPTLDKMTEDWQAAANAYTNLTREIEQKKSEGADAREIEYLESEARAAKFKYDDLGNKMNNPGQITQQQAQKDALDKKIAEEAQKQKDKEQQEWLNKGEQEKSTVDKFMDKAKDLWNNPFKNILQPKPADSPRSNNGACEFKKSEFVPVGFVSEAEKSTNNFALFSSDQDTTIDLENAKLHVARGTLVGFHINGESISILNLHDNHLGAVRLCAPEKHISIGPGQQLLISSSKKTLVNDLSQLPLRKPEKVFERSTVVTYTTDFSMSEAIRNFTELNHLVKHSTSKRERKLSSDMLKTAAGIHLVSMRHGVYKNGKRVNWN